NLYRITAEGAADQVYGQSNTASFAGTAKLNDEPLTGPTWWIDRSARLERKTSYFVRVVHGDVEGEPSRTFTLPAASAPLPYVSVPLQTPAGYTPGDASIGDLDGDGRYEIVLKQEQTPRDNSQPGFTGNTLL